MPEGHTLHRLAVQIDAAFVGAPWRVSSPQGRFAAGAQLLDAQTPRRAEAWGKHLFVHLDSQTWHVHLGLYGAFTFRGVPGFATAASIGAPRSRTAALEPEYQDDGWLLPEPPRGAVRARIQAQHGWADLRGPVTCAVLEPHEYQAVIQRLGPDPLRQPAETIDPQAREAFLENLSRRRISIAAALMDQAVIAGVGNIYRAESLFEERLAPDTPSNQISQARAEALWGRITEQLRTGVTEGVIRTLRGRSARRHWVYKHHGTECLRCSATIAARELAGRRLFWCPGCQLD